VTVAGSVAVVADAARDHLALIVELPRVAASLVDGRYSAPAGFDHAFQVVEPLEDEAARGALHLAGLLDLALPEHSY
jgi:hypothetical protein